MSSRIFNLSLAFLVLALPLTSAAGSKKTQKQQEDEEFQRAIAILDAAIAEEALVGNPPPKKDLPPNSLKPDPEPPKPLEETDRESIEAQQEQLRILAQRLADYQQRKDKKKPQPNVATDKPAPTAPSAPVHAAPPAGATLSKAEDRDENPDLVPSKPSSPEPQASPQKAKVAAVTPKKVADQDEYPDLVPKSSRLSTDDAPHVTARRFKWVPQHIVVPRSLLPIEDQSPEDQGAGSAS